MRHRTEVINHLITKYGYKKYLEIGIAYGECIDSIRIEHKDGVDPNPQCSSVNYPITSDQFFANLPSDYKYDIIFIDGLHLHEQVIKDVDNSLNHLSEGGIILLHDCNPEEEYLQVRNYDPHRAWTGDVWKTVLHYRRSRKDLSVAVINIDWGIGLIKRGSQDLYICDPHHDSLIEYDYSFLHKDRTNLLNLINVEKFLNTY